MQWKIIPVSDIFEYSEEIKNIAQKEALEAVINMKIELTDEGELDVSKLGEKWRKHISVLYSILQYKFKDRVDDLIVFADRANSYAAHYEAALRSHASKLAGKLPADAQSDLTTPTGCQEFFTCGDLLAQHYSSYCKAISPDAFALSTMPSTSDVLRALGVNRALQAALVMDKDIEKALDLLCDSSGAIHLAGAGDSKVDSFYAHQHDKKMTAKKVAASGGAGRSVKLEALKSETIRLYEEGSWATLPLAAADIRPKIIELSKKNGPVLSATTNKPLEWLRAHKKSKKSGGS